MKKTLMDYWARQLYVYCFLQVVLMNITGRIAIPLLPIWPVMHGREHFRYVLRMAGMRKSVNIMSSGWMVRLPVNHGRRVMARKWKSMYIISDMILSLPITDIFFWITATGRLTGSVLQYWAYMKPLRILWLWWGRPGNIRVSRLSRWGMTDALCLMCFRDRGVTGISEGKIWFLSPYWILFLLIAYENRTGVFDGILY